MDWSAQTDKDLALALKEGNDPAFEELVRRHQGRVYAIAYRLTGNREDALDIAQESLLKAYRRIDAWQPTGNFLPWLLRLTTNQAIDFLRRRKRQRHERLDEGYVRESDQSPNESGSMDTGDRVQAQEIDGRIRGAMSASCIPS